MDQMAYKNNNHKAKIYENPSIPMHGKVRFLFSGIALLTIFLGVCQKSQTFRGTLFKRVLELRARCCAVHNYVVLEVFAIAVK